MKAVPQETAQRIIPKVLAYLTKPKPVLRLAEAIGEDEAAVKAVLYSLRMLGVVEDLHGDKVSLHCVIHPDGAQKLIEQLNTYGAQAAEFRNLTRQRVLKAEERQNHD